MQESLESVLRLQNLLSADSSGLSAKTDITRHWGRIDAHKIRAFIVNPWKHKGVLKDEKTELINDPQGALGGYSVSLSGLRDVRPLEIDELKIEVNAHHYVKMLVSGMDSAYALFLDESSPSQHKEWFAPAQCRSALCKKCKKEMRPCEICNEALEMVGEKLLEGECNCDGNRASINEAIRWIRYCEKYCDDPTFPKCLEDEHFLLSNECLFSPTCRDINSVLIANRPEPVFYDNGAIGYAAGTYTGDEIMSIMRPLREKVDECLTKLEGQYGE